MAGNFIPHRPLHSRRIRRLGWCNRCVDWNHNILVVVVVMALMVVPVIIMVANGELPVHQVCCWLRSCGSKHAAFC
jgi:hypothetical protein